MRKAHGFSKHRLYSTWINMMSRCYNNKATHFNHYGGRGIYVCNRWHQIENFISDMEPSFVDGLTLDRIDVNGNYEPSNCRWATQTQQNINTRMSSLNKSGFRGVSFCKFTSKWTSKITVNKKQIKLGRFKTAKEAAVAYDKYVISNNLEYSLNFKGDNHVMV